jgi:hypothetical protein
MFICCVHLLRLSVSFSHVDNEAMTGEGGDKHHMPVNENPPLLPKTPVKQQIIPLPREQPARAGKEKSYLQFRNLQMQGNLSPFRLDAWKYKVQDNLHRAFITHEREPQSFKEAIKLPVSSEWQEAMKSKLHLLEELDTFTLTKLPEGRKAIGSKWT